MKTTYLTERNDTNQKTWFLSAEGDLLELCEVADYPGEITEKVITHGMYPGSVEEWRNWVLGSVNKEVNK